MKLTEEQWKERVTLTANEKGHMFNGWYGEYKRQKTKLRLYCSEHGEWTTTSIDNYTNKKRTSGCPECSSRSGKEKLRGTAKTFIEMAKNKHGDKYGYSNVDYKNNRLKVSIDCPLHGPFMQAPKEHLSGKGCPLCGGSYKGNTDTFIKKAIEKHGEKYDYGRVKYTKSNRKVEILCSEHGPFKQTPSSHLNGNGCPSCGKVKYTLSLRKSLEDFVLQAEIIHGQRYDYSSTAYTNSSKMVSIRCKHHGYFEQLPANHLKGSGCPLCAGHLQNQAYIHLVKDLDIVCALKLGIARDWLKRMLHQNKRNTFQVENVGVWQFNSVMRCKTAERECKQTLKTGVLNERELKDGWTETVSVLDLEKVISIYEKHGGKRIK